MLNDFLYTKFFMLKSRIPEPPVSWVTLSLFREGHSDVSKRKVLRHQHLHGQPVDIRIHNHFLGFVTNIFCIFCSSLCEAFASFGGGMIIFGEIDLGC